MPTRCEKWSSDDTNVFHSLMYLTIQCDIVIDSCAEYSIDTRMILSSIIHSFESFFEKKIVKFNVSIIIVLFGTIHELSVV